MPQNFRIFRALQCLAYLRGTEHRNAGKIPKFWGMRCTKHCNARKIQKTQHVVIYGQQACIVYRSLGFLGVSKHYSFWCTSCPKTLGLFEHYRVWCIRATKHRNAGKIPKFWGMRCTKHCNARKIQKNPTFGDLWPSSLHSLQKFGFIGIFQALECLVHLMPQSFGIFRALQCLEYLRAIYYSITLSLYCSSYILFYYSMTLLLYYPITFLLYYFISFLLKYFVTLLLYSSIILFLHYWYGFTTLVVYLCTTIVLHRY